MKKVRLVVSSIILGSASALAAAQTTAEHNVHHPEVTATGGPSASAQTDVNPALLEKQMDTHMQTMHAFHEKFQKASPAERQALMSEHHELMQKGMKMMGMASARMQGMGMKDSMSPQTAGNTSTESSAADHTMMLKRMDMMQSMMQMMMDRMPAPTTPAQ